MTQETSNQKYKFKTLSIVRQTQEKAATHIKSNTNDLNVFETGQTKTLSVTQLNGTKQNFSYGQYLSAWFGIDEENSEKTERVIKIHFAAHTIIIHGYCLDEIYEALATSTLKSITAHNDRYYQSNLSNTNNPPNTPFITKIEVNWRGRN